MSQFTKFKYFTFNGKRSDRFNLMLLDIEQDSYKRKVGIGRTIEEEDSIGDTPLFIRTKPNSQDITIEIGKVDGGNNPLPLTDKDMDEINRWLFVNEYKPLVIGGRVYYCIFDKTAEAWSNMYNHTYLVLSAHLQDGFVYSPINVLKVKADGEQSNFLTNISTIDKNLYIDMNILQAEDDRDIVIENKTNGSRMVIKGVKKGEEIFVYGFGREVYSLTDETHNLYNGLEYTDFVKLGYGSNKISVSGNCTCILQYQMPLALN